MRYLTRDATKAISVPAASRQPRRPLGIGRPARLAPCRARRAPAPPPPPPPPPPTPIASLKLSSFVAHRAEDPVGERERDGSGGWNSGRPGAVEAVVPANPATHLDPTLTPLHRNPSTGPGLLPGGLATAVVFALGWNVLRKGLTVPGVIHSFVLGSLVAAAFGPSGFVLLCGYFVVGTLVTRAGRARKERLGIAEGMEGGGAMGSAADTSAAAGGASERGRRGPGSVWGSGAAAAAASVATLVIVVLLGGGWGAALGVGAGDAPAVSADVARSVALLRIGCVASIASKLADTVSSEIGKAFGKATYLSTAPWKGRVPPGTEGAVSAEGTGAGALAAIAVAAAASQLGLVASASAAGIVVAAAVVANAAESALGASLQGGGGGGRQGEGEGEGRGRGEGGKGGGKKEKSLEGGVAWLTNDVINVLQVCVAALLAMGGAVMTGMPL